MTEATGKKLRVIVSKNLADAKTLQTTTPEAMCFASDVNALLFNGNLYGVHKLGSITTSGNLTVTQVNTLLGEYNAGLLQELLNYNAKGIPMIATINDQLVFVRFKHAAETTSYTLYFIRDEYAYNVTLSVVNGAWNIVGQSNGTIRTSLTNSLTSTSTSSALTAAQGKVLYDEITTLKDSVGAAYKYKGTKETIAEVLALTDAKVGDVWNVSSQFTLGGKTYPAYTNVGCIVDTSTTSHTDANWDAFGGVMEGMLLATDIINNLTSTSTNKVLSAAQGKVLNDKITALDDQLNPLSLVVKGGTGSSGNTLASPRIVEKGTTLSDTLTCTFTKGGAACAFKSLTVDGTAVTVSGTGNQLSQSITVTADKTVACVATDTNGKSITTNYKYQFVDASYFGVVAADFANSPTAANITAVLSTLTKSIKASKAYNTAAFTQNNQKCIYMYPSSFGALTKIVDGNNFDMTASFTKTTVTVNSIPYLVYVLTSPSSVTNYNLKFS